MKKIAALLYIFIFIFTSCYEEVDYDDLGVKNIIVVNGRFIDGETPWCQVSRSDIIFDQIKGKIGPIVYLPDANVTATDGDADYKYTVVSDKAMMEAKGLIAKAGETYTIKAKANGLEDVYSTVTIPNKPKADFKVVSVEEITETHNGYYGPYEIIDVIEREPETYTKVTYELNVQDDPNTEDYYQIVFYAMAMEYEFETIIDTVPGYWYGDEWIEPYEVYTYNVIDSAMVYKEIPMYDIKLTTEDPVMNWNEKQSDDNLFDDYVYNGMNIFNDQLFNGQTSKIRFEMSINTKSKGKLGLITGIDFNTIDFEVRHINKEMYMYYRTSQLVRDNDYNGTLSPYILYCNVENGAGMIAAWSAVKAPFKVPDQAIK
jgi:hypothetical protein